MFDGSFLIQQKSPQLVRAFVFNDRRDGADAGDAHDGGACDGVPAVQRRYRK